MPGEMLREGGTSHDLLLNTWPVIAQGDVHTYLQAIKARDHHVGHVNRERLETMPVEDASVEWSEEESPCVTVLAGRAPPPRLDQPGAPAVQ